jgi:hypothetical protein
MSDYHGIIPEPRPISFEQDQKGVGRLVMSIPMVFQKDGSGAWIPMPTKYPSVAGYSFAGARGREAEGGAWNWEVTFEGPGPLQGGGNNDKNEDQTVYAFEPSDADIPLTSHPDVLKFIKNYGGRAEEGRLVFGVEIPKKSDGSTSAEDLVTTNKGNPFFGVEAYLSFGGTWTKSYLVRNALPADLFTDVERIVAAVPQPSWMKLPPIGKDRNWLKRMPSFRVRGKAVEVTERYLLSGRGGHNTAIYTGRNG